MSGFGLLHHTSGSQEEEEGGTLRGVLASYKEEGGSIRVFYIKCGGFMW